VFNNNVTPLLPGRRVDDIADYRDQITSAVHLDFGYSVAAVFIRVGHAIKLSTDFDKRGRLRI
jgi:hypothetical protein